MERNYRHRTQPVLPFGFAPQVLPALQVAEWLTGRRDVRHRWSEDGDTAKRR
jgi:hypothetical protein